MDRDEAIRIIESNWPPSNYTLLREALTWVISTLHATTTPAGAPAAGAATPGDVPGEVERREDMTTWGRLRLRRQEDGDICVEVFGEHFGHVYTAHVEFCTPFAGGGKSPRTFEALKRLMVAMAEDNAALAQGGDKSGK